MTFEIYKYKIKDWDEVKQELLSCYEETSIRLFGNVLTNWNTDFENKIYTRDEVYRILSNEVIQFMSDFKVDYQMTEAWFQQYEKNMSHDLHDHDYGYSCVVYIEFDPKVHHSTVFVDDDGKETTLNVEEGDMIFFDSSYKHKCPPNKANKRRVICSFNLKQMTQLRFKYL